MFDAPPRLYTDVVTPIASYDVITPFHIQMRSHPPDIHLMRFTTMRSHPSENLSNSLQNLIEEVLRCHPYKSNIEDSRRSYTSPVVAAFRATKKHTEVVPPFCNLRYDTFSYTDMGTLCAYTLYRRGHTTLRELQ